MKKLLLLFLFITSLSFAQQAYYNDVDLTANGLQLRDNLATKIINTHTHYLSYADVWEALKITDLDPADPTNSRVLLIYGYSDTDGNYVTDRTRSKTANGGTSGTDWNREHTYAKSLGNPNLGTSGPGSDAHHLRAADVSFNSQRSSKKFAAGTGNAGDSNGGWYPGDEWKGDIARMMMYMYLRYGNQCLPSGVAIGSTNTVDANMIDLLLQWNAEDPVSQEEDNRNTYLSDANNTYGQGNRNPFIDNPYLATRIWGGPTAEDRWNTVADTQAPTAPTNLTATNITNTTADLNWTASNDDVAVTSYAIFKNGVYFATATSNTYTATGLTQNTTYNFTVYAKDAAGNTSTVSNTVMFTTLAGAGGGGGSSTELFISEYVEGSSYNKAIEIANFTGNSVDLSQYTIKKQSNGAGAWSSGLVLSGQLTSGSVFVAANSNAVTAITSLANILSSGTELSFNGNDAVGLFKNGVLIDIIGTFNGGTANFAKDVTLRRKSTIVSPNTTYTVSEWDSFPIDTFDGLGTHSTTGATQNINVLFSNSFETGWDGWIDGGTDCYRINSAKSFDGNYSIRIRDNSGTQSAMTSSSYDVSIYNNLEIKLNFYSYSMEANEDFWLQYFDGTSWKTVKSFISGVDFTNNTFTAETINISSSVYNFPVNAQFRFQCDASSNSDEIYIDNVIVTASSGAVAAAKNNIETVTKKQILSVSNNLPEIEDMEIYPNPALNNSVLKSEIDIEDAVVNVQVKIMNLQGRLVKVLNFKNVKSEVFEKDLQLTNIESGVYFVNISTNNGLSITKRLIVK
jgi:endonuclease I